MFYYAELYLFSSQSQVSKSCFPVHSNCNNKKITSFCQRETKQGIEKKTPFTQFSYLPGVCGLTKELRVVWNEQTTFLVRNLEEYTTQMIVIVPLKKPKMLLTIIIQIFWHWGLKYLDWFSWKPFLYKVLIFFFFPFFLLVKKGFNVQPPSLYCRL